MALSSCASYSCIATHLPNLLFFVLFVKPGLEPANTSPLPAGAMFSLSRESDGRTVQSITEEGAPYPGSDVLFIAVPMVQLPAVCRRPSSLLTGPPEPSRPHQFWPTAPPSTGRSNIQWAAATPKLQQGGWRLNLRPSKFITSWVFSLSHRVAALYNCYVCIL